MFTTSRYQSWHRVKEEHSAKWVSCPLFKSTVSTKSWSAPLKKLHLEALTHTKGWGRGVHWDRVSDCRPDKTPRLTPTRPQAGLSDLPMSISKTIFNQINDRHISRIIILKLQLKKQRQKMQPWLMFNSRLRCFALIACFQQGNLYFAPSHQCKTMFCGCRHSLGSVLLWPFTTVLKKRYNTSSLYLLTAEVQNLSTSALLYASVWVGVLFTNSDLLRLNQVLYLIGRTSARWNDSRLSVIFTCWGGEFCLLICPLEHKFVIGVSQHFSARVVFQSKSSGLTVLPAS